MAISKAQRRKRIKFRIRKIVKGTLERGRLSVYRSSQEIYAQIIDDSSGKTIVAASSLDKDFKKEGTKTGVAKKIGITLAEKALKAGVEKIAFDRNGYPYHGRIKSLAEGAREGGLKF